MLVGVTRVLNQLRVLGNARVAHGPVIVLCGKNGSFVGAIYIVDHLKIELRRSSLHNLVVRIEQREGVENIGKTFVWS